MIGFLTTWRIWLELGLAAALLGALGIQTDRVDHALRETAEVKAVAAQERLRAADLALQATNENRAKEQALQARVTTAEESYVALQTEHARTIVAQRAVLADNGKLRNDIAAFARGSTASSDTAAAASERAATLGLLLAEALRADAESSNDAEANADAVRTVLAAWPRDEGISLPKMKLGS